MSHARFVREYAAVALTVLLGIGWNFVLETAKTFAQAHPSARTGLYVTEGMLSVTCLYIAFISIRNETRFKGLVRRHFWFAVGTLAITVLGTLSEDLITVIFQAWTVDSFQTLFSVLTLVVVMIITTAVTGIYLYKIGLDEMREQKHTQHVSGRAGPSRRYTGDPVQLAAHKLRVYTH